MTWRQEGYCQLVVNGAAVAVFYAAEVWPLAIVMAVIFGAVIGILLHEERL